MAVRSWLDEYPDEALREGRDAHLGAAERCQQTGDVAGSDYHHHRALDAMIALSTRHMADLATPLEALTEP